MIMFVIVIINIVHVDMTCMGLKRLATVMPKNRNMWKDRELNLYIGKYIICLHQLGDQKHPIHTFYL